MSEVIDFSSHTSIPSVLPEELSPKDILDQALELSFKRVIVVGTTEEGKVGILSTEDLYVSNYLLDYAKNYLLRN